MSFEIAGTLFKADRWILKTLKSQVFINRSLQSKYCEFQCKYSLTARLGQKKFLIAWASNMYGAIVREKKMN